MSETTRTNTLLASSPSGNNTPRQSPTQTTQPFGSGFSVPGQNNDAQRTPPPTVGGGFTVPGQNNDVQQTPAPTVGDGFKVSRKEDGMQQDSQQVTDFPFIVNNKPMKFTGSQTNKHVEIHYLSPKDSTADDHEYEKFPNIAEGLKAALGLRGQNATSVTTTDTVSAGLQVAHQDTVGKMHQVVQGLPPENSYQSIPEGTSTANRLSTEMTPLFVNDQPPLTPRQRARHSGLGRLASDLLGEKNEGIDVHAIEKESELIPFGVESKGASQRMFGADLFFTPRTQVGPPEQRQASAETTALFNDKISSNKTLPQAQARDNVSTKSDIEE